ncbi:bacterio-opsin activator domain-containing protein [Natrialbaceae archaeon AArc-T1-2]|uniref:bacterio-opsin activator domain-containing protein n=1 Tax=Natrialbaceae archaeon AArc-T1-2 TaxID=3053904 RepID=UPI00255B0B97|nr:bacterio-opsin activator domain-containing protein [Natrialbaceae archaeon AArc-T1-2]WIV67917.1 bacterio-opsin activator domain-containing protein [Natrialbaceae archaeon AArc-T1-2]
MSLEEPRSDPDVLSREQYDALLDAAATYREALVVRLAGEVGLRPAELARIRPGDVTRAQVDPLRYLLTVPTEDGDDDRAAYLPTGVERELRRYVRSNDIDDDEPIFSVTPRRLQMLVSDVADRAADLHAEPRLESVSTSDLRRRFAYASLVEHEINPRVVKAVGGWQSFEGLEPYLSEPNEDAIVDAFETIEGNDEDTASTSVSDDSIVQSLLAASDGYALIRLDEDGYVDRWNRSAATMFGYRAGEIIGTHVSAFYTDDDVERGVPDRMLSAAAEGSGVEEEGWRVGKDGSTFFASEVVSPIRDDRGRHRGFAVLVADASEFQDRLETTRRERDELESRLSIARLLRAVTGVLFDASTHEEIETDVTAVVADADVYDFAWIDRRTFSGTRLEWRATSGIEPDDVERLSSTLDDPSGTTDEDEPSIRLSVDRDVAVDHSKSGRFEGAVAAIPLEYGDTVYGTLRIGTSRNDAFDDDERAWLETIGRQVGYGIAAVRRRNLLLSDTLVELEIACRDADSFFVDATDRLDCRFELDSLVPISESTHLYYVHLEGSQPAEVFELAEDDDGIEDFRLVESYEDGYRLEFVVHGSSPTLTLTEYGATVLETVVEDGEATIVAECAADADLRTIVDGLRSRFPGSELLGKREVERSVQTAREFREGLEDRLTDRQEAALRAAYFGGYYDWPRESTAEEIADAMGVSSPTLHNHLRKAQHELLRTFFDESTVEDRTRQ